MRKTDGETDNEAKGEADRQIQTYKHAKKLVGIETQYSEKERYMDRQTDRHTDRLTNRRTDRQIDR